MYFIYSRFENIFLPFKNIPLLMIIPYAFVIFLIHSLHAKRWSVILKTMNHDIPFIKLLHYRIMGFSLNYFIPAAHIGGEPLKAAMLKENKVPYPDGVSSLLIDKSFEVFADGLLGILGIIILTLSFTLPKELWNSFIILSLILILVLFNTLLGLFKRKNKPLISILKIFNLSKIKLIQKLKSKIEKTDENITQFFVHNKTAFFESINLSFLMWILMFIEYKLLLFMIGFDAGFFDIFIIISFVGLAYFVPIPAALGVLEAGQMSAFSILGLKPYLGVTTSLIIRAKDTLIALIGLILVSLQGVKYKKKIETINIKQIFEKIKLKKLFGKIKRNKKK